MVKYMNKSFQKNLLLILPVMFIVVFIIALYALIPSNYDGYKTIKSPAKDFIEEVKVKYISNFNNLEKEAIEVKSDAERSCEVTEINSKEMSLHITDTKIGTTTEVWLHKPKVKFRVYDLTNQLGVDPKFEQYIKESQKACLDLLKIKEEQKEKQRAEKQISLLKN